LKLDQRKICSEMLEKDIKDSKRRGLYKLCGDEDAELLFGSNKGRKLREIFETSKGKNYLIWLMEGDFPKELQTLIKNMWESSFNIVEDDDIPF